MFTPGKFFQKPYHDDTSEVQFGNETFLVRRLNGRERQEFNDLSTVTGRSIYVLSHCLLDGVTKEKIGDANAEIMLERFDALSNRLIEYVLDLTAQTLDEERLIWELAEKNSLKTNTKRSIVNTAIDTNSTPGSPSNDSN